jgi:hypothetical protein
MNVNSTFQVHHNAHDILPKIKKHEIPRTIEVPVEDPEEPVEEAEEPKATPPVFVAVRLFL